MAFERYIPELKKYDSILFLYQPITSGQPLKIVQRHMAHPVYCNLLLRKYLQEHSSSNLRGFIQALNALINYKNGHFQSFKLKYVLNLNGMKFGCKLLLLLGWPFFLYLKLFLIGVQMLSKIYAHSLSKKFSPPE